MPVTRRIYVSLPADPWLAKNINELKWGIVEEIEKLGYLPEIFTNPKGKPGLASAKSWSPRHADEIARRCVGAAIIGMPRWKFADGNKTPVLLPTEFNHYEGALVHTLKLPTLVLVQSDVLRRVVFDMSYGGYLGLFDGKASLNWLHSEQFRVPFQYWKKELAERRDLFLGYCSSSQVTAASVKRFLQSEGATVLDWQTDFIPGQTIMEQIEQAAERCLGGVFLFTRDDDLAQPPITSTLRPKAATVRGKNGAHRKGSAPTSPNVAVPRDNVVFEAGYFVGLKGKHNVLIIRESGSKMPADLGGDIYASLPDRTDILPIERSLRAFLGAL